MNNLSELSQLLMKIIANMRIVRIQFNKLEWIVKYDFPNIQNKCDLTHYL